MVSQELALGQLQFAVRAQSPVTLFTGPSGSGKSRLVEELFDTLPDTDAVVIVSDPGLLQVDLHGVLDQAALEARAVGLVEGQVPLLILDDAHKLPPETLARIIAHADPPGARFHLLLVGPADFGQTLQQDGLVGSVPEVELAAASDEELRQFVAARLRQLGARQTILTSTRVQGLIQRSRGNLRRIDAVLRWHLSRRDATAARGRPGPADAVNDPEEAGGEADLSAKGPRRGRGPAMLGAALLLIAGVVYLASELPARQEAAARRSGPIATATQTGTGTPAPYLPAVAALPEEADRLYRAGLASDDPVVTAADLARAALLGHARSAYFLGQIYEGGEGVPASTALATAWYRAAAPDLPRAAARARGLAASADPGVALTAPEILHAERRGDTLTAVWADRSSAPATVYHIEFAGPDGAQAGVGPRTPLSAQSVAIPPTAAAFRLVVTADEVTADGASAASAWFALPVPPQP